MYSEFRQPTHWVLVNLQLNYQAKVQNQGQYQGPVDPAIILSRLGSGLGPMSMSRP